MRAQTVGGRNTVAPKGGPRGSLTVALAVGLLGCSDPVSWTYEGTPGAETAARFASWVPSIDVAVAEHPAGNFLIDTGAPVTMADTLAYPAISAGVHTTNVDAFGLRFPNLAIAVFNLFGGTVPQFSGILGGDILSHFALTLDYQGNRVWLDDVANSDVPTTFDPAQVSQPDEVAATILGGGRATVPGDCSGPCGSIDLRPSRFVVELQVEDHPETLWAVIDTGATATVFSDTLVSSLTTPNRPVLYGVTVRTADGLADAYFTRVWSLRLGNQIEQFSQPVIVLPGPLFSNLTAETGRSIEALIGGSFLRNYLTTLDYPGESLTVRAYTAASHIDQDEFIRVGFTMASQDGVWEIQDVYAETDAALAGLKPGDVIRELDGQSIEGQSEAVVAAALRRHSLGDVVSVGRWQNGIVEVLAVEVEDLLPSFEAP